MSVEPRQLELWLREFHLNGFIIFRELLPRELVNEMHEQLLPLALGELEKARAAGTEHMRGLHRIAFDLTRYTRLLGGPLADPRFTSNPIVEDLVTAIFERGPGPGGWQRGWTQTEVAFPGCEYMHWHSDQVLDDTPRPDELNRTVRMTFNIPLVNFTWANGAMELIPGSHHLPRHFLANPFLEIPNVFPVRLDLRAGDAILRDGNGLHRGTPNLSDLPRPMLDQTYKRA